MPALRRRDFLNLSLAGFAGALSGNWPALGESPVSAVPFAPDTLFLTWQRDPTTTMTIQWIGPAAPAGTQVQFAKLHEGVWQTQPVLLKPYPDTDLKVHRCELTELSPGTEYQFVLGTTSPIPANSPVYRFRTMPAKATNTIQFVSGGDAGIGPHAINSNILAGKQDPYFALIAGDLAYDNGRSPETFVQFIRNYSKHVVDAQGRLVPMLACIGNHEVNGGYGKPRDASPAYLSVFDGLYPELTYGVLDIGDYLSLVLLDTNHIAPVAGAQTEWLEQALKERQDRPHLFVANHVPAYPSVREPKNKEGGPGTGDDQRVHWCPLFERYNVDVVLEHHDHAFKRSKPLTNGLYDKYGVVYLGDGSWGKIRPPKSPEQRPYLARVDEAYHISVHRLEGDERFHVALADTGRIADVCHTVSKRPAKRG